jgi:phosphohistidine phosphatase SixA
MRALSCSLKWLVLAFALAAGMPASAQMVSGPALMNALRQGGYVLVMRHASSPAMPPAKEAADPENVKLERQLDSMGKDSARAMGEAMKTLRIPVGDVFASPTFRVQQTVKLAALGNARIAPELGEDAAGMQGNTEAARTAWLKAKVAEAPRAGTNMVLVTHSPNITAAFGVNAAEGETVIFHPDGHGGTQQVARLQIGDWPALAR